MKTAIRMLAIALLAPLAALSQTAPVTKDQVDAAKNAIDLKVYQETADLAVQKSLAETRKAIAEAEKAEALARIPPTEIKAPAGTANTEKFGAAGLVKAFDLARALAEKTCGEVTPNFVVYDATIVQGVVSARLVESEIARVSQVLGSATAALQEAPKAPEKMTEGAKSIFALPALTGGIKAVADLASLFKTNVTAAATAYEGAAARALFISSLAENCPHKAVGLGAGYLGELDVTRYEALRLSLTALLGKRQALADAVEDAKKRPDKAALAASGAAMLKQADTFIETLKPSDFSDKGPLYAAARYLAYAQRTAGSAVLDFDLRLEGLTLTRENIFTGQRVRLSGVALLWWRLHAADGALLKAWTARQITAPVEVDLRNPPPAGTDFWDVK